MEIFFSPLEPKMASQFDQVIRTLDSSYQEG